MSNRGHLIVAVGILMFWLPYVHLHDLDPLFVLVVCDWMGWP